MFIYLTKIFKNNLNQVLAAQFVVFNNLNDQNFVTYYSENFLPFKKNFWDENTKTDFDISSDGELIYNHVVRTVTVTDISCLPEQGVIKTPKIKSFYDLILRLTEDNCLYVHEGCNIKDGSKKYLPSFRQIRVSKSTMTITISDYDEANGRWYSRAIISILSNGKLKQEPFKFLVPQDCISHYTNMSIEIENKVVFNNIDYVLASYNCDLPICDSDDVTNFCEPLIVHYSYLSDLFREVNLTIDAALGSYQERLQKVTPSAVKDTIRPKVNPTGIFYSLRGRRLTKADANLLFTNVERLFKETDGTLNSSGLLQAWQASGGRDNRHYICMNVILDVLSSSKLLLDRISLLTSYKNSNSYEKLKVDLYLYNTRVGCMFNPRILEIYKDFCTFEIAGSVYNEIVRVREVFK